MKSYWRGRAQGRVDKNSGMTRWGASGTLSALQTAHIRLCPPRVWYIESCTLEQILGRSRSRVEALEQDWRLGSLAAHLICSHWICHVNRAGRTTFGRNFRQVKAAAGVLTRGNGKTSSSFRHWRELGKYLAVYNPEVVTISSIFSRGCLSLSTLPAAEARVLVH